MKIGLGSDHGGFQLKGIIKEYLEQKGYEIVDYGTHSKDSVDYPEYGEKVAQAVSNNDVDRGIIFCGTGIGISLAANKVKGIRCANVSDTFSARMCRLHNDANMLSLGERVVGAGLAMDIVDLFLETEFEGGRHTARVEKLMAVENNNK